MLRYTHMFICISFAYFGFISCSYLDDIPAGSGNSPLYADTTHTHNTLWNIHLWVTFFLPLFFQTSFIFIHIPCHHRHSFPPKFHMEITIRGLSCSILEAICPICHLSISSSFHSLMSQWSKAFTLVSLLQGKGQVFTLALSMRLPWQAHHDKQSRGRKKEGKMQYWTELRLLFWILFRV